MEMNMGLWEIDLVKLTCFFFLDEISNLVDKDNSVDETD